MAGPRSYTDKTLKRLFGLARNKCSFPKCQKEMSDEHSAKHSNICHIEAANDRGERYNSNMTDIERADYDNLILLCPPCHDKTNDKKLYTVGALKKIKTNHELEMKRRVSNDRVLNKRPSLLANVIKKIVAAGIDQVEKVDVSNSFTIEEKIRYNSVIQNKPVIKEYCIYNGKVNAIYIEFERSGNGKKESLLRAIKKTYLDAKGEILEADQSQQNVQKNADNLINKVQRDLHDLIDVSPNNDNTIPYEEVEFAVSIIMVDAFMRCKILEEPKNK